MIKQKITFTLLILTTVVSAQIKFKPGYIVTNSNDTVYGEIDYRGDYVMGKFCKFKNDSITITYKPGDIKAYRFVGDNLYVSKQLGDSQYFLEYLIKGKLNVYYLRNDDGDFYYIEKEGYPLTVLPFEEGVKYHNETPMMYKSTKHKGVLNYYTNDAPELQSKIEIIEGPDHRNMVKLAQEYHNKVCKDEPCIVYQKKVPFVKLGIEPYYSHVNYDLMSLHANAFGCNLNFGLPRLNEKFYFKTGMSYNS